MKANSPKAKPLVPVALSSAPADDKLLRWLKWLIWLYFLLLIFEGALRKWFLPGLSTPLLLIRDPIVIAIYGIAVAAKLWPRTSWITVTILLALAFTPVGLLHIANGGSTPFVLAYGLRTNFLHLPLIFVMAKVFDAEDVRLIGKWTLLIALPMAVLMVLQFKSPIGAPINKAIGDGVQLDAAMGKIRPPGTFSFVTGAVDFAALLTSFLLLGAAAKKVYPFWLTAASGLALGASLAVSGSRSSVLSAAIVLVMFLVTLACTGRLVGGMVKLALLAVIAVGLAVSTGAVDEGIEVLTTRWKLAKDFEDQSGGASARLLGDFTAPFEKLGEIPALGLGIGRGTNVGAQALGTPGEFLLMEGEWGRVICEAGPLLGCLYLLFRVALACWLGLVCFRSAIAGNALPLLLWGACGRNIVNGQFGPATSLGFAVFVAGLALASTRLREEKVADSELDASPSHPGGRLAHRGRTRREFRKPRFASATT